MAKNQPIPINWSLKTFPVTDLKEYKRNPRVLTADGLKDLKDSISKFGIAEPPVLNLDKTIIGGHGRKKIFEELGIKEVNCYIPDRQLNKKEFEELNIRLNKNIAGEFDFDMLANEFNVDELKEWGFKDHDLGISNLDIDKFFGEDHNEAAEPVLITCPKCGNEFQK